MIGIYKVTSPSGRVYIGQSINIPRRFQDYRNALAKGQPRLNYSFIKYGLEAHIFEALEECELPDLNIRERHYQDLYNVLGVKGLNCGLTMTNEKPKIHSEATKAKIKKSNKTRMENRRSFHELAEDEREEVRDKFIDEATPANLHHVVDDELMAIWYWVECRGGL